MLSWSVIFLVSSIFFVREVLRNSGGYVRYTLMGFFMIAMFSCVMFSVNVALYDIHENKKEVVIYCFNNGISVNPRTGISSDYDFFKKFKLEDFSFFKEHESYPKESILIDDYVAEQAHKYKVIKNDLWKQGLADSRKISYILDFANELAHRAIS